MAMEGAVDDEVALVTGASRGIGKAAARALAEDGIHVVLLARSEDTLTDVAEEIRDDFGVRAVITPADVREYDAVSGAVLEAVEEFGRLDVLVNNAGYTGEGYENQFEEIPVEEFHQITRINVFGMFYATHAALPFLRESRGTVVFVGSSAGKHPRPGAPVYAASKWWTRGFALSLQAHVGQDGVAVSLVNPTAVRTQVWRDELDPGEAAEPEELGDLIAMIARQPAHSTISEVDLFRRDMLGKFVPADIDLELSFDPS